MNFSLKSLWPRNPGGWSAVDMQGGIFGVSVKLPQQKGGKPTVLQHMAFLGQTEVNASVLAQLGRSLTGSKFEMVAMLGRHQYQIFMVDKPAVRSDEMESSLRLVVSSLIDYPISEATLGWLEIPVQQSMGGRVPQLYTAVAKMESVSVCSSTFEEAHLRLDAIDIRESAQRNISFLLENEQGATCLLYAGVDGVQLTITYRRELYLVRFIAETLLDKAALQTPEQQSAITGRLALEIHRSFDFVRRNYPSLNLEVLHVAPTAQGLDLAGMLRPHLGGDVRALDLAEVFDFPAGSDLKKPEMQAQFFGALGAALRMDQGE